MNECAAAQIARVGVDLSGSGSTKCMRCRSGKVLLAKSRSPERFLAWCADPPAGCMVATEACGGAHHVARRLLAMSLDARLIAAHFVDQARDATERLVLRQRHSRVLAPSGETIPTGRSPPCR